MNGVNPVFDIERTGNTGMVYDSSSESTPFDRYHRLIAQFNSIEFPYTCCNVWKFYGSIPIMRFNRKTSIGGMTYAGDGCDRSGSITG